jgi:hypothetical protein
MIRLPVNEFLVENRCVSIRLMAIAQHFKEEIIGRRRHPFLPCTQPQAAQYRAFYFQNAQRFVIMRPPKNSEEQ